jgi:hypothetical protein
MPSSFSTRIDDDLQSAETACPRTHSGMLAWLLGKGTSPMRKSTSQSALGALFGVAVAGD